MNSLINRANNLVITAAAAAAIGLAFLMPGQASAANTDGPWPEPPSCSNETGTCTSIEDQLAYECFFENESDRIKWCDDPVGELSRGTKGLTTETPHQRYVLGVGLILK